ncbi:MAG TPA: MFS transporter [Euzebyales bacterium]|nr:MFS transporter [Euzebyales bacterium]
MTSATIREHRAGPREWVGLAVLTLACLLYVMDLTVLHLAVPTLSAELQPTSAQLLWIVDIYGYMVAAFLITMGTFGDRIGRRRLLLFGAAGFGAVSIMAAYAASAEQLIAARALLGVAGATLAPSTLSLIFAMFTDPRQRATAVAVWISAFSAGSAVGPVLGGVLLEQFWWGSVFLLALPVIGALLVLGPLVLPEYRDPDAGRLDLASVGLSLVAVLAVIFGCKQIAQDGIGIPAVAAIVAGVAVGVVFARRQLTLADPMIDLRLFRDRRFSASLAVNLISIFMVVGYFLYVAQYLQLVIGLSPLQAGLWSVPSAVGFIVGSQLAPYIVARVDPGRIIVVGLVLAAVGLAALTLVGGSADLAVLVAASVVISLGLAPVLTLTTDLIVGSAPPERAGAASGISETAAELGGALGLSILGSVGVAVYRAELAGTLPAAVPAEAAAVVRDTLGAAVAVAGQLPAGLEAVVLAAARAAFIAGVQVTAAIAAVIAVAVAGVAAATFRQSAVVAVSRDDPPPLAGTDPTGDLAPSPVPARCGDREVRQ